MIKFENVAVTFDNFSLEDLSFHLRRGEKLGIWGPSGSGKSTIVDLILGFLKPCRGRIEKSYKSVSTVFQEDRLIEEISAYENIRAVSPKDPGPILSFLGLDDYGQKTCQLSGGMKRRLALARALVYDGELLILDEPFTGLDERNRARAIEAIGKFSSSKSIILISHRETDFALMGIDDLVEL